MTASFKPAHTMELVSPPGRVVVDHDIMLRNEREMRMRAERELANTVLKLHAAHVALQHEQSENLRAQATVIQLQAELDAMSEKRLGASFERLTVTATGDSYAATVARLAEEVDTIVLDGEVRL